MLNLGVHLYLCTLTLIHCNTIVTLSVLLKYVCTLELLQCIDVEEVSREVSSTFKGSFFDFQRKFLRLSRFVSTIFGSPFWFYTSLIYMIVCFWPILKHFSANWFFSLLDKYTLFTSNSEKIPSPLVKNKRRFWKKEMLIFWLVLFSASCP